MLTRKILEAPKDERRVIGQFLCCMDKNCEAVANRYGVYKKGECSFNIHTSSGAIVKIGNVAAINFGAMLMRGDV